MIRNCQWINNDYLKCSNNASYYHRNKFKTTEIYGWFCLSHKCPICKKGF